MTVNKLAAAALKWTAIAIWFDLSERLIGSSLDWAFALNKATVWLDGFTNVVCK